MSDEIKFSENESELYVEISESTNYDDLIRNFDSDIKLNKLQELNENFQEIIAIVASVKDSNTSEKDDNDTLASNKKFKEIRDKFRKISKKWKLSIKHPEWWYYTIKKISKIENDWTIVDLKFKPLSWSWNIKLSILNNKISFNTKTGGVILNIHKNW